MKNTPLKELQLIFHEPIEKWLEIQLFDLKSPFELGERLINLKIDSVRLNSSKSSRNGVLHLVLTSPIWYSSSKPT